MRPSRRGLVIRFSLCLGLFTRSEIRPQLVCCSNGKHRGTVCSQDRIRTCMNNYVVVPYYSHNILRLPIPPPGHFSNLAFRSLSKVSITTTGRYLNGDPTFRCYFAVISRFGVFAVLVLFKCTALLGACSQHLVQLFNGALRA